MYQHGLRFFTDIPIVVVGLLAFLFAYITVVIRLFISSKSANKMKHLENLPLEKEF